MEESINDFMQSETWKVYQKMMEDKEKFVKHGPNVLHFDYFDPLLIDSDFQDFESKFEKVGLALSRFEKTGVVYAHLEEFTLLTSIALSQPLLIELLKGTLSNAAWEIIKYTIIKTWRKIWNFKYPESKKMTFGLKVKLDHNTSFNISLSGDLDPMIIDNALDKVLDFLKEQSLNPIYKHPDYVYYDQNEKIWKKIDVEKEIRRIAEEQYNARKNESSL